MKKSLQKIFYFITLIMAQLVLGFNAMSQTTETFTTPGSFQWTCPPTVTSVTVQVWGGGGKGSSKTAGSNILKGGGGGGGAFASATLAVVPGQNYFGSIGMGSSSNTTDGESSSFSNNTISVLAAGGFSVANNTGTGGGGGLAGLSTGTTVYFGGSGSGFGGGGSSAGTSTNGNNATSTTGTGATAPTNGGNGGNAGATPTNGSLPGGGGGGYIASFSSSTINGGNGANGQVKLIYTIVPCSGTPNNGTIALQSYSGMGGLVQTITSTGLSETSGITLQWQSSIDGGVTFNSLGLTTPNEQVKPMVTTSYRLKSTCANSGLFAYSNIVTYTASGVQMPISSGSSVLTDCSNTVYDPGGNSNPATSIDSWLTINPSTPTHKVNLKFTMFNTGTSNDYLRIYNGGNATYPVIGTYSGTTLPPSITSTATDGSLTLRYISTSDFINKGPGFIANLICLAPCTTPTNQPTNLTFSNITSTAINGTFTPPVSAPNGYLVLRSTSATAPGMTNGVTLNSGSSFGSAGQTYYIVVGNATTSSATTFVDNGLAPSTNYYYYIYSYNDNCASGPYYLHLNPLTANQSTTTALPVTILNVTAAQKNAGIEVSWNTTNETNIASYEVEESSNASIFTNAKTVAAKNATNNTYTWFDPTVNNGNNYYRIKAIEKNGTVKYSNVVKLKIGGKATEFTVYPNPVKEGVVSLQITNAEKGIYTIKVYNAGGQEVANKTIASNGSSITTTLTLGNGMAKGNYKMQINNGTTTVTKSVIVD
jgi:hypothetical protein